MTSSIGCGHTADEPPGVRRLPAADVAGEVDRQRKLGVGRLHVSFVSESCEDLPFRLVAFATRVAVLP